MRSNLTPKLVTRRKIGAAFGAALALSLGGCLGYDGEIQHGYVVDQQTLARFPFWRSRVFGELMWDRFIAESTSTLGTSWYPTANCAISGEKLTPEGFLPP